MSAEIDTTVDGTVRFAGRERKRWWGVGNQITDPYDVERSLREAYLTFRYETRGNTVELLNDVQQVNSEGLAVTTREYGPTTSAYNRSIIKVEHGQADLELGGTGTRWQAHQPGDLLEFFVQVSRRVAGNLQINTAGSIRRGAMVFAAAVFDRKIRVLDCEDLDMYLTALTSIYGSTIFGLSGIQVECANTADYFLRENTPRISYGHQQRLDVSAAVEAIGIVDLDAVERLVNRCAKITFDVNQRAGFFQNALLGQRAIPERRVMREVLNKDAGLYETRPVDNPAWLKWDRERGQLLKAYGEGPGQDLPSRAGTLFGTWSAVTDFCDHQRRSTADGRGAQAMIGGAHDSIRRIKTRALEAVTALAA